MSFIMDGGGKVIGGSAGDGGSSKGDMADDIASGGVALLNKVLQMLGVPVNIKGAGSTPLLPDISQAALPGSKNIMPSMNISGGDGAFQKLFAELKKGGMQIKDLVGPIEGLPIKDMPVEALSSLQPLHTGGAASMGEGYSVA